jgi:hypothetical protein
LGDAAFEFVVCFLQQAAIVIGLKKWPHLNDDIAVTVKISLPAIAFRKT